MIIKPKNWHEFQHYKDRCPPWIKLHHSILDNYEFHMMQDASKALAMCLWLIASEHLSGEIDASPDKLAFRLRSTAKKIDESLKQLIDNGFFFVVQVDSNALADRRQDAPLEEERQRERQRQNIACPHQEIISLYHEVLSSCPGIKDWTPARRTALQARWGEQPERQNLVYWKELFEYISKIPFLTGQVATNGRKPFFVTLDWIVKADNFAKIREGKYEN